MHADIVIINGNCMTMKDHKVFEWLAIKNDKIIDLGKGQDYLSLAGDSSIVIDAEGRTVLPGFIDSHFHVVQTAMNRYSLNLDSVSKFDEIGEKIQEYERAHQGEGIFGVRLDKEKLKDGKFPNRQILDSFSGNVPIWLNCRDYQVSMLNTYGLLYYKIPFGMDGIEMDKNGVATGIFRGRANAALRTNILNKYPNLNRRQHISNMIQDMLSVGITTVNAMEGGYMYSDKDAQFIYENEGTFPIDMELFYQSMDIHKVLEMGLKRIGGCLYVDGTMGARTAALSFEYADRPSHMGSLIFSQNELNEFVDDCYQHNLQLSLYTIGDRASDMALKAHEYAFYKTGIKGLRHRLEHAELVSMEQIKKARELGVILSMNPTYERYWGGPNKMYSQRLGARYVETNKFREIIDNGVRICAGSDSDICEYNPLLGIHSAVNHPVPSHSVSVYEAIEMYTVNGAYAIFQEGSKGTLEREKTADVIILDDNINEIPKEEIDKMKVRCTIKSGALLHNSL